VDRDDLAFVGAGAVDAVKAMRHDVALMSACAAGRPTGLSVRRWGDARVKQAALANADRVALLVRLLVAADKFERTAAHVFARISKVDRASLPVAPRQTLSKRSNSTGQTSCLRTCPDLRRNS
jgi:DeoR/GlpR family transcriptional regulator of sugar metabolism